jgi:G6PDH family F420-dependent oxidoreductase
VVEIGYALSSEEHSAADLVRHAELAEEAGFGFALISDHYHPWLDRQGHSPFVWDVIGAISQRTERLVLGTGVTCPTVRMHPAIVAQAAATAATLMPGRFFLGLGTGEALNEHIVAEHWPPAEVRLQMLEEEIEVLRLLWQGGEQSHYGDFFVVENARIYDLPDDPLPILVAASGEKAAELAGRTADGLIATAPNKELVAAFKRAGTKRDRPRYGQIAVSWAKSEKAAIETALEWWPTAAVHGELGQELRLPAHFEQAVRDVTGDQIKELITCGPDIEPIRAKIDEFADAGFSHVYIHQVGPEQERFIDFCAEQLLPSFAATSARRQRSSTVT